MSDLESITIEEYARRRGLGAQDLRAEPAPPVNSAPTLLPAGGEAERMREGMAELAELTWRQRIGAAQAEEAEIRVARAAGRALDRERAERAVFEAFRELRDATFAAVKSQARKVHGLTELREIEVTLEDELRDAFAGWETRMRAKLAEAAGA